MPGHLRYRGKETPQIVPKINKYGLNVEQPGFVTRYELNKIYNRSKVFVYLGNSGENDRGPLEATSVGCLTILGGTTRHAPCLGSCELGICVSKNPNDPKIVANEIEQMINAHTEELREHVALYFDGHNGFESVILPNMIKLFDLIRKNPIPNIEVLKKAYL
jgi:glycosyltransferase involved in cell wall biosynthesis